MVTPATQPDWVRKLCNMTWKLWSGPICVEHTGVQKICLNLWFACLNIYEDKSFNCFYFYNQQLK